MSFVLPLHVLESFVVLYHHVCVMALTATATKQTLSTVIDRIEMKNPVLIGLPPERSNIMYIVTIDD